MEDLDQLRCPTSHCTVCNATAWSGRHAVSVAMPMHRASSGVKLRHPGRDQRPVQSGNIVDEVWTRIRRFIQTQAESLMVVKERVRREAREKWLDRRKDVSKRRRGRIKPKTKLGGTPLHRQQVSASFLGGRGRVVKGRVTEVLRWKFRGGRLSCSKDCGLRLRRHRRQG